MIKLKDILIEDAYNTFEGFIRVTFDESEYNASQTAEVIRSLPSVTVARLVNSERDRPGTATMSVKTRTLGAGEDSFKAVRTNALKVKGIRRVEIGFKTIEKI